MLIGVTTTHKADNVGTLDMHSDLKKPSGDLQTFEFDFAEDSPCYVSHFLWDSI